MYYATLKNNQLITPGHDGAELITDVDGPGIYQVRTCREREGVVEFGSGTVLLDSIALYLGNHHLGEFRLTITDHKVEILCSAQSVDYAQE